MDKQKKQGRPLKAPGEKLERVTLFVAPELRLKLVRIAPSVARRVLAEALASVP